MPAYIEQQRCTVQSRKGIFCDAATMEDMPFPICTRHAIEVYRRVRHIVDAAAPGLGLKAGYVRVDIAS